MLDAVLVLNAHVRSHLHVVNNIGLKDVAYDAALTIIGFETVHYSYIYQVKGKWSLL